MPRTQLPVYSPVSAGSVAAGALALLGDGAAARARVEALVRAEYAPLALSLTASGTAALTLALGALRRRGEREGRPPLVALPAYACFDLATALVGADCRATFYDVDPATLGPDWASLERALAEGPLAVVVAHLYGVPVDTARVRAMADAVGALVVDDAAQGVGAMLGERPVGAHGSLGVLSFGRGKGRTGGAGGALLAMDDQGAALLRLVGDDLGRSARGTGAWVRLAAQWVLARPSLYWIPAGIPAFGLGETPYHDPEPPRGMPAAVAAALAANWHASMHEVEARRRAAAAWRASAHAAEWSFPASDAAVARAGMLRLPAVVPPGQLGGAVASRHPGAMPGYPRSLPTLPALAHRVTHGAERDGAEILVTRLLTLPTHRFTGTT